MPPVNETRENLDFTTGWKKCSVCGLVTNDLQGDPPRCPVSWRCERVKNNRTLGGKVWEDLKARRDYSLTAEDQASIRAAVLKWKERNAEEAAEGAIILTAILDEAAKG